MAWRADVDTDTQLAEILGVTRQAVAKAERRGTINRIPGGGWDAFGAVLTWRRHVNPLLQRESPVFRPWLDPQVPMVQSMWDELTRRARRAGARVWCQPECDEDGGEPEDTGENEDRDAEGEDDDLSVDSPEDGEGEEGLWTAGEVEDWLSWPSQVAPRLAAALGVDPSRLAALLETEVKAQLDRMQ